ncbi:hypothetical protein BH11ACT1_BH11ACT1_18310 [soil metagenome]
MPPRADEPRDDADEPAADDDPGAGSDHSSTGAPGVPVPADDVHEPTEAERWDAIVAQLADLDGPVPDAPAPHDDGTRAVTYPVAPWVSDPRVIRPAGSSGATPPELTGRDWDGTSQIDDAEAAADAEEHFEPTDPGPVLGGDPLLTMAWFAAVGMPVFFFILLIAWRDAPTVLVEAAGVVFALGVAVLVWRMPNHRRDDSDDDHGAVV